MNLMDKFSGFELNVSDRISEEDKQWLNRYQFLYEKALNFYKNWYALCEKERANYTKNDYDVYGNCNNIFITNLNVKQKMNEVQRGFVGGSIPILKKSMKLP